MRLPIGFRVRVREDVRRIDRRLLVGGSPLRAVRLTDAALARLDGGEITVVDAATEALAARLVDGNLADPVLSGVGVDPAGLTVVIPVRDRPDQLDRALEPLVGLGCIVVDDDSHDPDAVADVARRHGAHLVRLPQNLGPASARNAGLRAVSTPYVAFVDSDVDLVWRLVEAGEVVRYDPEQVAWHDTRTTIRGWLGRKYLYGTGAADLAVRHGRKGAPAVMTASMAATAAALMVHRRWSLPVAAAGIAYGTLSLRRRLPETPGRDRLAVQLCAQGLGWTVRQEAALLLRHWWPLTVLLAPHSRLLRRALAASLLVDVVVAQVDNPGTRYRPLARRLDDMAYGAGLWAGAIRVRSVTCLLPRRPGQKTGQGGTSPNG